MLRVSPDDDRLLLERPLGDAARLYAAQIAGLLLLAVGGGILLLATLAIEQVTRLTPHGPLSARIAPTAEGILPLVIGLVAGVGLGTMWSVVTYRRERARRMRADALDALDTAVELYNEDDYERAAALAGRSLSLFTRLRDAAGVAEARLILGNAERGMGDDARAEALARDSLSHFRALGDTRGIAEALTLLGDIDYARGDLDSAYRLYRSSLDAYRSAGDDWEVIRTLGMLASIARALGREDDSRTFMAEAVASVERQAPTKDTRKRLSYPSHTLSAHVTIKAGL